MQPEPLCPVCGATHWQPLEKKQYERDRSRHENAYSQRQYHILFEAWFVGQSTATITSVLCRQCGFVAYLPRPSSQDVDRKYEIGMALGKHGRVTDSDNPVDRKRADRLFAELSPFTAPGGRILDYGGGDGRLMSPFVEAGHRCYLADYLSETVPGVRRLCDKVESLPPDRRFEVIVVNHVLEHVSEPFELLAALSRHQDTGGILFVEVPMELWRRVPPRGEPVTHINFFSPDPIRYLLARSGYRVLKCKLRWHYTKRATLAVRAIARRVDDAELPSLADGPSYARSMMEATPRAGFRLINAGPLRAVWAALSVHAKRLARRSGFSR